MGIVVFVSEQLAAFFDTSNEPLEPNELSNFATGQPTPDGTTFYINNRVGFGHE